MILYLSCQFRPITTKHESNYFLEWGRGQMLIKDILTRSLVTERHCLGDGIHLVVRPNLIITLARTLSKVCSSWSTNNRTISISLLFNRAFIEETFSICPLKRQWTKCCSRILPRPSTNSRKNVKKGLRSNGNSAYRAYRMYKIVRRSAASYCPPLL